MTSEASSSRDDAHPTQGPPPPSLSPDEVAILSALVDGMFPSDDLGPGALDIGVVDYLLKAFAGPYGGLVPVYRDALAALDAVARREHGRGFAQLASEQRDAMISRLEHGQLEEWRDPGADPFFGLIWQHLREGLFGDPIHGGNRQMLGWRLIGFPGAQFGYTAEEQQLDLIITREPRSVADLGANRPDDSRT